MLYHEVALDRFYGITEERNGMRVYRSQQLIGNEKTLHIFGQHETREMEAHTHDFIEIVYVRSGSSEQYIDSACYRASRGDLLFINYGASHRFVPIGEFSYINICFNPEILAGRIITPENAFAVLQLTAFEEISRESDTGLVSFSVSEREEIESILSAMEREYRTRADGWKTVLESYMNILLIRILRKLTVVPDADDRKDKGMWRELCDYIDENLGAELGLSALAGKCFYNPSYFSRVFKERFGMTLSEYIGRRKVEQVVLLSGDRTLSAETIAHRAGFSSKSHMYRTFQRVKGIAFSEFRKNK